MSKNKKSSGGIRTVKGLLLFVVIFAISYITFRYIITRTVVDGNSMYPTLKNGDSLIVTRQLREFERFDIVVFQSDFNTDEYIVKRVIGLPGENVYIDKDSNIYINGVYLEEHYGAAVLTDGGRAAQTGGVTLGEGEYFVMGDNRNRSEDSRFELIGNVNKKDIIGKVIVRIWPLDTAGYVDLYLERNPVK